VNTTTLKSFQVAMVFGTPTMVCHLVMVVGLMHR